MNQLDIIKQKHYSELTENDWKILKKEKIVNWYWPSGSYILNFLVKKLSPIFQESNANIHDFTYWQGGDELQRKKCDDWFFDRLIRDSIKSNNKLYYVILSIIFYISVRILWKNHFNYINI